MNKSNVVRIPNPGNLFDPLYLTAHSLIDQFPRSALASLIPTLREALSASESPVNPEAPPEGDSSPSERDGPSLVVSATGCDRPE